MKKIKLLFFICCSITLFCGWFNANPELISIFPLHNYDQTLSHWIKPNDPDYDKPIFDSKIQQKRLDIFFNHYFGNLSPWDADYVNKILHKSKSETLKALEENIIEVFNNKNKQALAQGYNENFQPYPQEWVNKIMTNMNIQQFDNIHYDPKKRAIAIDNLYARSLPTDEAFFYHYKIPGQGFPFDQLQMSAIWAGTPIYILSQSRDHAWTLVLTPDYVAWVKSSGIARASNDFIKNWKTAAFSNSIAITHTQTPIVDTNGVYRFSAYVGSFFPGEKTADKFKMMVPVADQNQCAAIHYAFVSKTDATPLPLLPTPHHFSNIMGKLLGRPYGWGNLYFYNDCSAELKNLFTPFGIWLPRHSSDQLNVGKTKDLSSLSPQSRIEYVMKNAHPFSTLIYVPGHILLFIGNYANPKNPYQITPLTFQNKWGFTTREANNRVVIGKSVLFPLLERYPEDPKLITQAGEDCFKISMLDE